MQTLTKIEMEALTPAEQECARMLGLDTNPRKRPRKSHVKCTGGKPYILVTTMSCRLCGALHTRIFHMTKQKNKPFFPGNALFSKEISKVPSKEELGKMKVKHSQHTKRRCKNCYNYLETFKKEDLINKFLSYINDGRNSLT